MESIAPPQAELAEEPPVGPMSLGIAFSGLSRTDDGMSIFEGQGLTPQFMLLGSYDTELAGGLRLGGELSWGVSVASNEDYFGGSLAAESIEHRALLGAILSAPMLPRLWPHVRAAGGFNATKVHIDRDAAQAGLDQWLMAPMAELTAGLTFHWPVGRDTQGGGVKFRFGIRVEGGYALSKKTDIQLMGGSDRKISTQLANLGSLHTSGPLFRVGLVLRF